MVWRWHGFGWWQEEQNEDFPHILSFDLSWKFFGLNVANSSLYIFFHRKFGDASGTIHLAKFKSPIGWKLECVVWPPTEGRMRLHVPVGVENKGWFVFWDMLQDFLLKVEKTQHSPYI